MGSAVFTIAALGFTTAVVLAVVLWYLRFTFGKRVLKPVKHPGVCQSCRYSLHGLVRAGKCPECSIDYDVDVPIKWEQIWNVGKDGYRTFLRTAVFVLCSLSLMLLQFPFTFFVLHLSGWDANAAWEYASGQTHQGSTAIIAAWPVLAAFLLAPFTRVARWKEYWITVALCVLTPPCLLFATAFHSAHWSGRLFLGFISGTFSGPAFWLTFLTVLLVCIRYVRLWSARLNRRIGWNEHTRVTRSVDTRSLESESGEDPADTFP